MEQMKYGQITDYHNGENWMEFPQDLEHPVDVFYLYPTAYYGRKEDEPVCAVTNVAVRKRAKEHVTYKGSAFKTVGNYFVPYYRQASLECLVRQSEADITAFATGPVADIVEAFTYYMENANKGRPYILAGHSQGSILIAVLLASTFKQHPEYLKTMIAAYVIGFGITKQYLKDNPHLKFAEGAGDYGVIISYNTEAPHMKAKNITLPKNSVAINPINWKRDSTKAPAQLSLGSHMIRRDAAGRLIDVRDLDHFADATLDLDRGVVICSTA
ncbi:MAG: DUF3089 domain-containing protein, partial [Eubacterium sp.]